MILTLLGLAQAISNSGNRLLVVIEEAAEKDKYSKFWGDLEGALKSSPDKLLKRSRTHHL